MPLKQQFRMKFQFKNLLFYQKKKKKGELYGSGDFYTFMFLRNF